MRWREEHRNALIQGADSMDTQDSNGTNGKFNRRPSYGGRGNQKHRQKRWQSDKSQLMSDSLDTADTLDSGGDLPGGRYRPPPKDNLMLDSTDDHPDNAMVDTSMASEGRSLSPRSGPAMLGTSSPTPLDSTLPLDDALIDFSGDDQGDQRIRSRTPSPPHIDDLMEAPTLPRRGSRASVSGMVPMGSISSLPRQPGLRRSPPPSFSRSSSRKSIPGSPKPPSSDFGMQVSDEHLAQAAMPITPESRTPEPHHLHSPPQDPTPPPQPMPRRHSHHPVMPPHPDTMLPPPSPPPPKARHSAHVKPDPLLPPDPDTHEFPYEEGAMGPADTSEEALDDEDEPLPPPPDPDTSDFGPRHPRDDDDDDEHIPFGSTDMRSTRV